MTEPGDRALLIGGEMPLSPDDLLAQPRTHGVLGPKFLAVDSGRTALRLIIQSLLQKNRRQPVLLPSYLCQAVLQPFLEEGRDIMFYRIGKDLSVDCDDLRARVAECSPSGVLFINYFGFPVSDAERNLFLELRKSTVVIEDCSHGSLLESGRDIAGITGDVVVSSVRKYCNLPDGAVLSPRKGISTASLGIAAAGHATARYDAKVLKSEFISGGASDQDLEKRYLELFGEADRQLDAASPMLRMSTESVRLLQCVNVRRIMVVRRKNFASLSGMFAENSALAGVCSPLYRDLPEYVSPLAFPVVVHGGRRDALRRELGRRRVFCPVHWQLPEAVPMRDFEESRELSAGILSLPLDQRYNEKDMTVMCGRITDAWKEIS